MTSFTDLLSISTRTRDTTQPKSGGAPAETDKLFAMMYDDLCRLANRFLQNEPLRNRLSSSSLVHQAYVRMVDQSRIDWQGKTHFFAIGATVMRRILVDHARKVRSLKRGGNWERRQLTDEVTFQLSEDSDVMALDELLKVLADLNPRQARIVELRFFGGMTMREIATEMSLGLRTVEKEWAMARAWMRRSLRSDDLDSDDRDGKSTGPIPSADPDQTDPDQTDPDQTDPDQTDPDATDSGDRAAGKS
jgi:RNA polymerase sigma-70 factor, ECF subfamily